MSKLTSDVSKKSIWRDHLTRHSASGKSISAFCRDEAISESNFYAWRNRLRVAGVKAAPRSPKLPTSFIDLGAVKDSTINTPPAQAPLEVRIDLGGGMLLTITRH